MTGTRHSSDRETFGQGMANMAAGILGGVATAATMRTVANIKFGKLASIIHGLVLFAILSGLGEIVAAIPNACLAAILFKVGIDIMDYKSYQY